MGEWQTFTAPLQSNNGTLRERLTPDTNAFANRTSGGFVSDFWDMSKDFGGDVWDGLKGSLGSVGVGLWQRVMGDHSTYLRTYTSRNVVHYTADAIVLIDGKPIGSIRPMAARRFNAYVHSISVTTSIEPGGGNASVDFIVPFYDLDRWFWQGHTVIQEMQEIEIYMKGRFAVRGTDGIGHHPYYKVFWGLITTVSYAKEARSARFSIKAGDILEWWKIMNVPVSPSTIQTTQNFGGHFAGANSYIYQHTCYESIVYLSKMSMQNIHALENLRNTKGESTGSLIERKKTRAGIMGYWADRQNKIKDSLRLFGVEGQPMHIKWADGAGVSSGGVPEAGSSEANALEVEDFELLIETPDYGNGNHTVPLEDYGKVPGLGIDPSKEVGITPHQYHFKNPGFGGSFGVKESKIESLLSTAIKVKDQVDFEFYMDPAGYVVFKPPFYNLDVRGNKFLTVENSDIVSLNYSRDAAKIYSEISVTGTNSGQDTPDLPPKGVFRDYGLIRQYGIKKIAIQAPFLYSCLDCFTYASTMLNRYNMQALNVTINLIGRPEVRPGYPVYVPSDDAFYYVTSVTHSMEMGGSFSTSLGIGGVRSRLIKVIEGDPQEVRILRNAHWVYVPPEVTPTEDEVLEADTDTNVNNYADSETGERPPQVSVDDPNDEPATAEGEASQKASVAELTNSMAASLSTSKYENEFRVYTKVSHTKFGHWSLVADAGGDGEPGELVASLTRGISGVEFRMRELDNEEPAFEDDVTTVKVPVSDCDGYQLIGYGPYGKYLGYDETTQSFFLRGKQPTATEIGRLRSADLAAAAFARSTGQVYTPQYLEDTDTAIGAGRTVKNPSGFVPMKTLSGDMGSAVENASTNLRGVQIAVAQDVASMTGDNLGDADLACGPPPPYDMSAMGPFTGEEAAARERYLEMQRASEAWSSQVNDIRGSAGDAADELTSFEPHEYNEEWRDGMLYIQKFYNGTFDIGTDEDGIFDDVVGDRRSRANLGFFGKLAWESFLGGL